MEIRSIHPDHTGDAARLYEICIRTGDGGQDAAPVYDNPVLLPEIYVGPYLKFAAPYALVLDDGLGPVGYVLGAPDTKLFEEQCLSSWWPELQERYPLEGVAPGTRDAGLIHHLHHPPSTPEQYLDSYPAHLHIDLLPAYQGRGYGRQLIEELFEKFRDGGVPGVHLGVAARNTKAIAFYTAIGMSTVAASPDGVTMGIAL